jgi:ribosomal protein S18 acetylase RimI-like enzyme
MKTTPSTTLRRTRVHTLEDLATRAWSDGCTQLDGWQVRIGGGLSLRANSVLPTNYSGSDPQASVSQAEFEYEARAIRPAFQIVPDASPANLPQLLAKRGYVSAGSGEMLIAAAGPLLETLSASRNIEDTFPWEVRLDLSPNESWLSAWLAMTGRPTSARRAARSILAAVPENTRLASARTVRGAVVGTGMGVVEDATLGLFCIASAAHLRRTGIARSIIRELAGWGGKLGAKTIYLQIASDNLPASSLYAKLGFATAHRFYHLARPTLPGATSHGSTAHIRRPAPFGFL